MTILYTVNPLLSPPGGLFISSPFEAGLIERGGLFNLETMMDRYQYFIKNQNTKWKSSSTRSFRSCSRRSESNPNFQLVNRPSRISPHQVLTVVIDYYLLVKNNQGQGGGGALIQREVINFLPLKRGAFQREEAYLSGGLNRGVKVCKTSQKCKFCQQSFYRKIVEIILVMTNHAKLCQTIYQSLLRSSLLHSRFQCRHATLGRSDTKNSCVAA